jgi:hypothetical protein
MQQCLKPFSGTAWTRIIPTQLFDQLFVAVYDAVATLDVRFGGETLAAFAHRFKRSARRRTRIVCVVYVWRTSF